MRSTCALASATSLLSHPSSALPLSLLPIGCGSSGRVKLRGPSRCLSRCRTVLTLSLSSLSPGRVNNAKLASGSGALRGLGVLVLGGTATGLKGTPGRGEKCALPIPPLNLLSEERAACRAAFAAMRSVPWLPVGLPGAQTHSARSSSGTNSSEALNAPAPCCIDGGGDFEENRPTTGEGELAEGDRLWSASLSASSLSAAWILARSSSSFRARCSLLEDSLEAGGESCMTTSRQRG